MLYGEVFAGDIDPECDPECEEYGKCAEEDLVPCHVGRWVTPIVMTIYLLVANLLLLNLLIATFNTIYNRCGPVNSLNEKFLWEEQRFKLSEIKIHSKQYVLVSFDIISNNKLNSRE